MISLEAHKIPKMREWSLVFVVLIVVSAISVASRYHLIETRPLAGQLDGQEPEAHILVTEIAFEQTSWTVHRFLPIFTLGAQHNKNIDPLPGGSAPDRYGNYYYADSPPLTFVLPYIAAKLTVGTPTLQALRWYNVFLQIAASAAMAVLVFLCLREAGVDSRVQLLAASTVALIYMTAPECLKSHTITLWAQQFYAFLLMVQLICFLFFPRKFLLFILAFIGSLADWTPYVSNMAMASVALYSYWTTRDRRALGIAVAILAGAVVGGLCMIAWFSMVMPIGAYFNFLLFRATERSLAQILFHGVLNIWRLIYFVPRYMESFGLFTAIGLLVPFLKLGCGPRKYAIPSTGVILPNINPLVISLLVVGISLLENVVLSDHAIPYSYDRLKGVQFLALFIVWGASHSYRASAWVFSLSSFAGIVSICLFWFAYDNPRGWNYIAHSQEERIGMFIHETASSSGPAFFNGEIRGSDIYYAKRNIFMLVEEITGEPIDNSVEYIKKWCQQHHFKYGTFYEISGNYPFPDPADLPRSVRIRHIFSDGRVIELGTVRLAERASDYHPRNKDWGGFDPLWK